MNAKERVMAVLNHRERDRMPCLGANSTVTYGQMEKVQAFWPEGHENGEAMAKQALAAHTVLGFDAVRVPFCQTFEAEALGCKIKPGGTGGIPGIDEPHPYTLDDSPEFPDDFLSRGRIPELLKAVGILKKELGDEVAIVAGIELIVPKTYWDYELEYQGRQFEAISVPKILHICGNVDAIVEWMGQTKADVLSLEPKANISLARQKCGPDVILMGGVDTSTTLFMKDAPAVKEACEVSIADGIQILAPGCSVAPDTPLENLLAMVEVAKAY
jgi:uroporphyrinogen-III decarboxylase